MIRKIFLQKVVLLIIVFLMIHPQIFGQSYDDSFSKQKNSQNETSDKTDNIIDFGKTLLGKPYKYITSEGKVLDCSGFVNYIYGKNGIELPRTSASLASLSEKISLSEIKKGDLLFFKGRNTKSKHVGHLSIVTSVDGDVIEMMHSCNRGILIELYQKNNYYTSRFLFAGRLPQDLLHDAFKNSNNDITGSIEVGDSIQTTHSQNQTTLKNYFENNDKTQSEPKTIKLIGVGDLMLGTNYPNSTYLPANDGKNLLQPVKDILIKGDVTFGNLEGVLLTEEGSVKKCSNPKVCYAFKMPNHYVDYLVEVGFNLLSIANNHIRDFGSVGTANTLRILNEAGIPHAGLAECPYTTFEKDGIRYGFAAFAPNTGTIKINDYANARKIISHLNSISDIVIISFHGGAEGSMMKHVTRKTEIFLGENRGNPYEFARMAIDAGADVVLGHGPHVTRAIDIYKDRFISYSLGNFATYGRFNLSGPNGISPIIELNLSGDGTFISGKIYSTKQLGEGGPVIDEQNRALKEIQELMRTDIPESILNIEPDGIITKDNKPTKR
jgi:poly-gamma-glutamate capsule biosynthesis protein CapA/YwtB (metallophosphatase superfamily)